MSESDIDLFGSDNSEDLAAAEEEFAQRAREAQARIDARNASKGKTVIEKSTIVLDCYLADPEIDAEAAAEKVLKNISIEGLTVGDVRVAEHCFGLMKLVVGGILINDLVDTEDIENAVTEILGEDDISHFEVVSLIKA